MVVEIGQRQAGELLADLGPQRQVQLFCKARHQEVLQRIEQPGHGIDHKQNKNLKSAVLPLDAEGGPQRDGLLDAVPDEIHNVGAVER